jgi:glutaredoxin
MAPPQLTIYTKPNCPLCDKALEQIERARQQTDFEFVEVNILSDPAIYGRYKNEIPVVLLNGKELFRFRLTAQALLECLKKQTP